MYMSKEMTSVVQYQTWKDHHVGFTTWIRSYNATHYELNIHLCCTSTEWILPIDVAFSYTYVCNCFPINDMCMAKLTPLIIIFGLERLLFK